MTALIDLIDTAEDIEASDYEHEVTEGYELHLEVNERVRPGSCCRGTEDICLDCHLLLFA